MKKKLTDRQAKTIPYLLSCSTIQRAAKEAGVSVTQLYEWMNDTESLFKDELNRQRDEVLEYAINKIKSGMTKAADVLVDLMDSENESIKRGAANDILHNVFKFKELQEIESRLDSIEKLVKESRQ